MNPKPAQDTVTEACILTARYRKAKKLAVMLIGSGASAEDVKTLGSTEIGRQLAAKAVGGNVPSEVTWALVNEMVQEFAG